MSSTPLQEYPTFGALARSALVMGIPLLPFAFILLLTACLVLLGTMLFGTKGILICFISLPLLILLRAISITDDRALNILKYEILCLMKRRNAKAFSGTNTVLASKYGRNINDYQRFFKQTLTVTNRPDGLFAKTQSSR